MPCSVTYWVSVNASFVRVPMVNFDAQTRLISVPSLTEHFEQWRSHDVLRAVSRYSFRVLGWAHDCIQPKMLGKRNLHGFRSVSYGFYKLQFSMKHILWQPRACRAIFTPSQKLVRGASFILCSRMCVLFCTLSLLYYFSLFNSRITCFIYLFSPQSLKNEDLKVWVWLTVVFLFCHETP